MQTPKPMTGSAQVGFECPQADCGTMVRMNISDIEAGECRGQCPGCHQIYEFDAEMTDKLVRLKNLIIAIRDAEKILGDCQVGVTVPAGEVKIPYALLLTRLNTLISLNVNGQKRDFHFWVEPATETFR